MECSTLFAILQNHTLRICEQLKKITSVHQNSFRSSHSVCAIETSAPSPCTESPGRVDVIVAPPPLGIVEFPRNSIALILVLEGLGKGLIIQTHCHSMLAAGDTDDDA